MTYTNIDECLQRLMAIPRPDFPDRKRMREAFSWDRLDDLVIEDRKGDENDG